MLRIIGQPIPLRGICARRSLRIILESAVFAFTLLGLLTACGFASVSTSSSNGTPFARPTSTPEFDTAVQQTVIKFCQAMSDGNYSQAYGYLSAHYKQTVTSPAKLPNQLPRLGKISGCMEFGEGHFIHVSGNHATDSVEFMMTGGPFGNTTDPGTLGLVQAGSTWQIDSISQ